MGRVGEGGRGVSRRLSFLSAPSRHRMGRPGTNVLQARGGGALVPMSGCPETLLPPSRCAHPHAILLGLHRHICRQSANAEAWGNVCLERPGPQSSLAGPAFQGPGADLVCSRHCGTWTPRKLTEAPVGRGKPEEMQWYPPSFLRTRGSTSIAPSGEHSAGPVGEGQRASAGTATWHAREGDSWGLTGPHPHSCWAT